MPVKGKRYIGPRRSPRYELFRSDFDLGRLEIIVFDPHCRQLHASQETLSQDGLYARLRAIFDGIADAREARAICMASGKIVAAYGFSR